MLLLHVAGHVEAVLREAKKGAGGALAEEIAAALGEVDAADSDDPLVSTEARHVSWASLRECWGLAQKAHGKRGLPSHLHEVVESTTPYHRTPEVRWRLENPNRKADYKKNKEIRKTHQIFEYKNMTRSVDPKAKEEARYLATMKEGLTMPMDFFVLILCAVPAAYMIAKLSEREHWGWMFAAVGAAMVVMVEGILITIRLSKADGWIKPDVERRPEDAESNARRRVAEEADRTHAEETRKAAAKAKEMYGGGGGAVPKASGGASAKAAKAKAKAKASPAAAAASDAAAAGGGEKQARKRKKGKATKVE